MFKVNKVRAISIILTLIMLLSITGCSSKSTDNEYAYENSFRDSIDSTIQSYEKAKGFEGYTIENGFQPETDNINYIIYDAVNGICYQPQCNDTFECYQTKNIKVLLFNGNIVEATDTNKTGDTLNEISESVPMYLTSSMLNGLADSISKDTVSIDVEDFKTYVLYTIKFPFDATWIYTYDKQNKYFRNCTLHIDNNTNVETKYFEINLSFDENINVNKPDTIPNNLDTLLDKNNIFEWCYYLYYEKDDRVKYNNETYECLIDDESTYGNYQISTTEEEFAPENNTLCWKKIS